MRQFSVPPHSSATLSSLLRGTVMTALYYTDNWRPTRRQVASWTKERGLLIDRQWRLEEYARSGDTPRDVARIAIDLQRVYKNVLVVTTSRNSAEKSAESLIREVSNLNRPCPIRSIDLYHPSLSRP